MTSRVDVPVDEFLLGFPPQVRRLASAARRLILATVPRATERVRVGWRLIGYNAPAYFAFISIEQGTVRIGFEWGVMLSDPSGLLEGGGSQVRYVAIPSAKALQSDALKNLLRSAAAIVPPVRERRSSR